jgi:hypothetical protein
VACRSILHSIGGCSGYVFRGLGLTGRWWLTCFPWSGFRGSVAVVAYVCVCLCVCVCVCVCVLWVGGCVSVVADVCVRRVVVS